MRSLALSFSALPASGQLLATEPENLRVGTLITDLIISLFCSY